MTKLEKVKSDAFEAISKYPHLEEAINDAYEVMIGEVEEGESEENEINHFYNFIEDITYEH